jgi:hypothetical protein
MTSTNHVIGDSVGARDWVTDLDRPETSGVAGHRDRKQMLRKCEGGRDPRAPLLSSWRQHGQDLARPAAKLLCERGLEINWSKQDQPKKFDQPLLTSIYRRFF